MSEDKIIDIYVNDIISNPNQPRHIFNEESLLELAESISQHGLLQPIIVRVNDTNQYELIAGERRLRAFELLGNEKIPAIITKYDSKNSAIVAMIENIQREDLHFIEIAKGYKKLIQDYGITQTELVSIVGKSQSSIANKIRILSLDDDILNMILDISLTERHSRALLKTDDVKIQKKIIEYVKKNDLNVKQTEEYINKLLEPKKAKLDDTKKNQVKTFIKDIRLFTNTIKQAVDSINTAGVGASYNIREENDKYTITIDIPIER